MNMDESVKEELAAAKEKSAQRRDRLQAQEEEQGRDGGKGGRGGDRGGDRGGKGGGGYRDREDGGRDRESGWGDSGGRRRDRTETMECFNCGGMGHSSRDCPEPPKEK